jgi:uncharacterized membrane protein YfcA
MNLWIIGAVIGLLSGITSGLLGVGGGIVMVPAFIYFLNRDPKTAVATSLAVIVPAAIVGVAKHAAHRLVDWKLVAAVVLFAAVGAWLGAKLNHQLSSNTVQKTFGVFAVLVGLKMIFLK